MSRPLERFSGFFDLRYTHSIMRGGFPVPIFDFINDPVDPLTFHCADGTRFRPASRFAGYDHGSVPGRAQSVVPATCATRSFVFHDSSFGNHGHWVSRNRGPFLFESLKFHETNHLMLRMMNVEGNPVRRCWVAFEGVQVGGGETWRDHKGPFPVDPGY